MKDLKGLRFGRLKVIEFAGKQYGNKNYWRCICDCGNIKDVYQSNLTCGITHSCGCLAKERFTRRTHGQRHNKIYKIWESMKRRCNSEKSQRYACYGGRGIKYTPEWEKFEGFYDWAVSSGYVEGLSLDRINPDGNYEPNNCRWIPLKEQAYNKTNSVKFTYNGTTKCLSEWANIYDIPYERLYQRIFKLGYSFEEAIELG